MLPSVPLPRAASMSSRFWTTSRPARPSSSGCSWRSSGWPGSMVRTEPSMGQRAPTGGTRGSAGVVSGQASILGLVTVAPSGPVSWAVWHQSRAWPRLFGWILEGSQLGRHPEAPPVVRALGVTLGWAWRRRARSALGAAAGGGSLCAPLSTAPAPGRQGSWPRGRVTGHRSPGP